MKSLGASDVWIFQIVENKLTEVITLLSFHDNTTTTNESVNQPYHTFEEYFKKHFDGWNFKIN